MRTLKDVLYEQHQIYVLDFHELSDTLKQKIDEYLIEICQGNRNIDLKTVKIRFLKHIKENTSHTNGFISEFLIHLLLATEGYQQYFQLFNLEDSNSFKKGFDGVYYKGQKDNIWLMESKSTATDTTHSNRINTAYTSITSMMSGKNNPWENAYNHISKATISSTTSIIELFNQLAIDFDNKDTFEDISNWQIILCGTVFTSDPKLHTCKSTVYQNISPAKNNPSKACIPVAITCRVLDQIVQYIEEGAHSG